MNKILSLYKQTCLLFFTLFVFCLHGQSDSNFDFKKIKIDGVAAVVGDFVILDSDIDKTLIDLQSQGVSTENLDRCNLLGKLMEDKLYAHHAEQDSLEVDNQQIQSYVDQSIEYFTSQLGSIEKVLEYYKRKNEQRYYANITSKFKNRDLDKDYKSSK